MQYYVVCIYIYVLCCAVAESLSVYCLVGRLFVAFVLTAILPSFYYSTGRKIERKLLLGSTKAYLCTGRHNFIYIAMFLCMETGPKYCKFICTKSSTVALSNLFTHEITFSRSLLHVSVLERVCSHCIL